MTATAQQWLTRKQLAERNNISYQTLSNWHVEGRGPRATKLGRKLLRYSLAEVLAWEADPAAYEAAKDRKSTAKSTKRKG